MIQHNPEIEVVIANATDLAKRYNHEYVTLEHLAHGLMSYKPWNDLMVAFGCDVDGLLFDLEDYLQKQTYITQVDGNSDPKKTHSWR